MNTHVYCDSVHLLKGSTIYEAPQDSDADTRGTGGGVKMGMAEAASWSIDSIQCSSWKNTNDVANIEISNFAMDAIAFQVVRTPDGDIVPFNTSSDFRSEDWYFWTTESDAIDSVILEIDKELNEWQTNIDIATEWVQPEDWFVRRGQAVDDAIWAGLAYLFDLRASMFETKIVEALAKDMKVETLLAKERIRKLRDKGFLGVAGKGNFAEGKVTKIAIEILIERGMMNAKEGK